MYKLKSRWRFTALILATWGAYCIISLLTPQDPSVSRYHISTFIFDFLIISTALPYLICWLYAVSGWLHIRDFARSQPPGAERDGFSKIAYGLLVLVATLVVPTMIKAVYVYLSHSATGADWNIFSNYMGVFFPLLSFLLLYWGSTQITDHAAPKITRLARATTVLFPVALFSVFYLFMIFTNPTRQASPDPLVPATYFLPDSLIVTTIVLPVVLSWLLGLLFVLNMEHYSHFSKKIYRPGLVSFYNGIIVLVAVVILVQVLASLGGNRFAHVNVVLILALLYILLGMMTFAFGLIARGAKKLRPPNLPSEPV